MHETKQHGEQKKDSEKARDALEDLLGLIKPCPNIGDYKEERHKYLDERYGC
ncbi:MAG: hypothetical protein K2J77_12400 [Oscillospiraceae bacterium]|nr:hypothetical protein [Oscillospiraceae bacterium]